MGRTNQKEVFEWMSRMERLNYNEKGTPNVYPKARMLSLVFGVSQTRAHQYIKLFNTYLVKRK